MQLPLAALFSYRPSKYLTMQESSAVVAMMMAMDRNQLIGKAGAMPWYVPGEQAYFKAVTMGKPIVMGRKTYESIGRALPGRTNIVVTRNVTWQADGVQRASGLEDSLSVARAACVEANAKELVIIGGAALCREAMPITQRLYLTVIDHEFDGDTWLDSFRWDDWTVISEDVKEPSTTGGFPVTYWILERA